MAVEASILNAFMHRVNDLGLGLPVAWPNIDFTPPADGKYIAVAFVPNGNSRVAISSGTPHRHVGLLQLSVFWPLGAGVYDPVEKADEVAAGFPADLIVQGFGVRIRVTKTPDIVGPLTEEHAVHVPVTVSWEAFA